jgi:phage shock protein A
MGFLSGKKKVDTERGILEIKGTMNALTLRIRRLETRMDEEHKSAKEAMAGGDKTLARSHLSVVLDLDNRRGRYRQQFHTLETALLNIEEVKDQSEVLGAFRTANDALSKAQAMLSPVEIQMQLDRLTESFEHISEAGELLSEDLSTAGTTPDMEKKIDQQLQAMEAEILLDKERVLPPLAKQKQKEPGRRPRAEEKRIDDLLADLEREAQEEKEREAEK